MRPEQRIQLEADQGGRRVHVVRVDGVDEWVNDTIAPLDHRGQNEVRQKHLPVRNLNRPVRHRQVIGAELVEPAPRRDQLREAVGRTTRWRRFRLTWGADNGKRIGRRLAH